MISQYHLLCNPVSGFSSTYIGTEPAGMEKLIDPSPFPKHINGLRIAIHAEIKKSLEHCAECELRIYEPGTDPAKVKSDDISPYKSNKKLSRLEAELRKKGSNPFDSESNSDDSDSDSEIISLVVIAPEEKNGIEKKTRAKTIWEKMQKH